MGRFGMRTTYTGTSTTRSILLSKALDAAISMATVHSHICFTRHAKEKKNVLYLFPDDMF